MKRLFDLSPTVLAIAEPCPSALGGLPMCGILRAGVAFGISLCLIACDVEYESQGESPSVGWTSTLQTEMAYLSDIEEVVWWEVDGNDVYIGFTSPPPDDWRLIINGAALHGNKAIDFGCHVWAVTGVGRGWRPGDGPYLGEVTARHGRIE